ncbi:MAG TPA: PAS domain-containing protein [Burkholderiales bacterium]|nr:PAS domain-containing protein [Burkholderiales bacterium]
MKNDDLQMDEELARAIAGGQVDAFVVGTDSNRRVLLLANAYQRYRQLVELMQQGAVTVNAHGSILYANQTFSRMLGLPLAQLYTAPLDTYFLLEDRARLGSFLMLSARNSQIEAHLARPDGSSLPVRMSLASFSDGYATLLVTDLRPTQWPALTIDALDAIRDSVEKLNRMASAEAPARAELDHIAEQVNGLARMLDEMLDIKREG